MSRPALRPLVVLGLLLTTGCTTLGPDFEGVDPPELSGWDAALHGTVEPGTDEADAPTEWWRLFDDPVLEALVLEAGRNNLSLQRAGLAVLQARALQGVAHAGRYPQVQQATAAATYLDKENHGGGETSQSYGSFQAGFGIGWELDFWGRYQRAIEGADAAFLASIEAQRAMQVLVKAEVATAYFNWRILGLRIEIAHRNAQLQKRSLEIATELYQSGNTSELDLQQARTQYLATLATIPQLELQRRRVLNAITLLLGRPPAPLAALKDATRPLPAVEDRVVRGIPARLLLRRPDVRAAAWAVAAQSARIGVAEADLYPAISLVGTLGWSSTTLGGVPDGSLLALGPSLRWNLFDHGLIRNNVRLQDALLQEKLAQYRQTVLEAAREVDDAAVGLVKTGAQEKILEQTVTAARRALEIAQISYREGYADFQRVLDAQRSLFTQNDRLLSIRGERLGYLVALYKGLGGGWSPADVNEMIPAVTRDTMRERTDWGDLLDAPLPISLPDPIHSPTDATP